MEEKDFSTQENLDNTRSMRAGTCEEDLASLKVGFAGLLESNTNLRNENSALQNERNFFSLKKSFWNPGDKKFLIELGSKVSEDSFQIDGDVYTIDKIEEDNKARLAIKKNNLLISEIIGNSSDIQIITKANNLFIELNNIEKLQDIEKFEFRIDYDFEGANKLSDLLYLVSKYTSKQNSPIKKIYYFNQVRSI